MTFEKLLSAKTSIILGADLNCDVQIKNDDVSAKHCQITRITGEKFLIVDLNSSSGTFVNNIKIETQEISETDFIRMGGYIFQLLTKIPELENAQNNAPDKKDESINSDQVNQEKETSISESKQPKELSIYCLYAPEDEEAAVFLNKHLTALRYNKNQPIAINGPFNRLAGDEKSSDENLLKNADIILVFLSVNIMDDATYKRSMLALDYYNKGQSKLIPILTRRCLWNQMPFAKLDLLPKNLEPLYSKRGWDSQDEAFTNVVEDIGKTVNAFYASQEGKLGNSENNRNLNAPSRPLKVNYKADLSWALFGRRMGAYILDFGILGIPIIIILGILGLDINTYEDGLMPLESTIVMLLILALVSAVFESQNSMATPGKMIFGLIITDEQGIKLSMVNSLKRNLVKFTIVLAMQSALLSVIVLFGQLGYFIMKSKFLQDIVTKTTISPSVKKAERMASRRL